jgi:hypothetical protein
MRKPKPMAQQSRAMCLARAKALADQAEARAEPIAQACARIAGRVLPDGRA